MVVLLGNIDWNLNMDMKYSAFNGQSAFLGATTLGGVALIGNAIDNGCHGKSKGLAIGEGVAGALLGAGAGFGLYKQFQMGEDKVGENHCDKGFGFMGPRK
jgi:hypothetical protein